MSTGQLVFTQTNIGMSAGATSTRQMGDLTYPDGCTFSRWKATKSNVSSNITLSYGNESSYLRPWDTWDSTEAHIKNSSYPGKAIIRVKNGNSSYITSDFTLTVEYTYPARTVTVTAGTGGTASANKSSASYGDSVTLTATPSSGYSFDKWTTTGGTIASTTSASTTLTMPNSNVTVTASFKINSYTLTTAVSPSGYGTVTSGASMNYGATKSLTATPATGRNFSSWSKTSGSLSSTTSNPTTFTMGAGNATVTANFGTNNYTLTVAKGTGIASVTGGGSKAYASSNAITATASTGYTFKNWTSNNGGTFANANSASTNFTMPAGNVTVTANANINSYTLTVAKGTGISSVTGGGNKNYGSSNAITATVSTGYTFNKWTSNNGGTFANANAASTNFTMPAGNVTVTASATINSYNLTTAVSPTGGGTVTAGGSMNYGGTKSLTATPATGYAFSVWTKTAGTLSSATTNPTTFTMGTSAATVTANFTHVSYTVSSAVSPTGGGTVTLGKSSAYYADSVSLTATPASGYQFTGWTTTGGTIASASSEATTLTMPAANVTVTAAFAKIDYAITAGVNPAGGGTISTSPASTAQIGDTVTISQSPNTGYSFDGFTTVPEVTITNNQFTMPAAAVAITANYRITASSCTMDKAAYVGGDTAVMSIDLASDTFTHKYKLSFGDGMETGWESVAAGVDTVNIYIPVEWSLHMSGATAAGTLVLQTYDGDTMLGDYTVTGLSYAPMAGTIPEFRVWRCDAAGNAKTDGTYGRFAYVLPAGMTATVTSGPETEAVTGSPDDIMPGGKIVFGTGTNTVTMSMTYGTETFQMIRQLPAVIMAYRYTTVIQQ